LYDLQYNLTPIYSKCDKRERIMKFHLSYLCLWIFLFQD